MLALFRRLAGCLSLLLLSVGLLAAGPAAAQPTGAPPVAAAADSLLRPALPQDTAAALRQLFRAQRRSNQGAVAAAGVSLLTFNYLLSFAQHETTLQRIGTALLAAYVGFELYKLSEALVLRRRYGSRREQQLLLALSQGRPLPQRVRQQLVKEVFTVQGATP